MLHITNDTIERINHDSLRILSEIGVRIDDDELRGLAIAAGAVAGKKPDTVCLPSEMVHEYVAMAPSAINYADCDGHKVELKPGGEVTFWTGAALNYLTDGKCQAITSDNLRDFTRVANEMDALWAVVGTSLAEVPPPVRDIAGLAIMAKNTRKHLRPLLFDTASVPAMIEIAEIIADGATLAEKPLLSLGYSCLPPLHWSKISTDLWRHSAGKQIPLMLNGEPITGMTSPITLAGTLSLANAEVIAGVVLVQLLEPGRPVVHNVGFAHSADMRTAACLSGTVECALMASAGARLAASWNLPSASWMCTDSFADDEQASMEKMLTGFAHAAAGVNVIWGMGQLESEMTISLVQLVMDNELALAMGRWREGIAADDDSLAFDVISKVIEGDEDFLTHEHTLSNFRQVLTESDLLTRTNRAAWQADGATTLAERAQTRVDEILASEPKAHLSDQQRKDIDAIVDREMGRVS